MFTGWFIIVFITSRINKFHWEVWMEICPFDENYCTLSSELSHTDHCARPLEWKRPSQSRTALHCADLLKMQTSWEELQIQRFQPKISGQQIVECCKGCRNATWYKQICQSQNGKKTHNLLYCQMVQTFYATLPLFFCGVGSVMLLLACK